MERRLRGVSLEDLATLTRIPRRSLERLESGAFDSSRDGFARGFVRTVAIALGLNPDDALLRLMGEPGTDDERSAYRQVLRWAAAGAALVAVAGTVAGLSWLWHVATRAGDGAATPEIVYRRDAVRELADSIAAEPEFGEGVARPEPAGAGSEARTGESLGRAEQ
jgi:hypothetical protein